MHIGHSGKRDPADAFDVTLRSALGYAGNLACFIDRYISG
jgi:hypothetical protein